MTYYEQLERGSYAFQRHVLRWKATAGEGLGCAARERNIY